MIGGEQLGRLWKQRVREAQFPSVKAREGSQVRGQFKPGVPVGFFWSRVGRGEDPLGFVPGSGLGCQGVSFCR